ncbi:hypothetical protein GE061_000007 [Apolygus lucorum]|uniref:Uncharacterized protein n=1 Tax=Apolygus lucorum TaxID=248454 RepID=A0A8S9Y5P9_APOLU|nr:hypothetical protein GE061_000007 [Apolygus lucorum]
MEVSPSRPEFSPITPSRQRSSPPPPSSPAQTRSKRATRTLSVTPPNRSRSNTPDRVESPEWFPAARPEPQLLLRDIGAATARPSLLDTLMRVAVTAEERLVVTLRYLATGRSYEDLKFGSAISAQLLGEIIPETCAAIIHCLKEYISVPHTPEDWKAQAQRNWRDEQPMTPMSNSTPRQRNEEGNRVRDVFKEYFTTVGEVSFQERMLNVANQ